MTGHEYLTSVLDRQKLSKDETEALQNLRKTIEGALRDDFGSTPRIYYGGSYGKRTMIKAAYDLDIVFYHPHNSNTTTVKQIRKDVHQCFTDRNWYVTDKDVALKLYPKGKAYHVDVVPGRAHDDTFYRATIYRSISNSTMQTSVKKHIDDVKTRRELIKLMKLWSLRHNLPIKTFVLEQATMAGAKDKSLTDLAEQMRAVLSWLRDNMETDVLKDPANTNNVISDLVTAATKKAVAAKAKWCCKQSDWRKIIW